MVFKAFLKRFFVVFLMRLGKIPLAGAVCARACVGSILPPLPLSYLCGQGGCGVGVGCRRGLGFSSRRLPVARLSVFLPLASLSADPQRGGGQCLGLGAAPQRQPPGGARPTGGAEPPQLRSPVRERGLDPKGSVCALPPSMVTVFGG